MNRGEVSLFGDRLRSFLPLIFVLIAASLMIHAQVLIVQAQVPLEGQSDAIEKSMRQSLPKEFPPESRSPKIIDKNKPLTHKAPANAPTFFIKTIKLSGNTVISDERLFAVIDLGEGKDVNMSILNTMADKITALYATEGYLLTRVFVPNQEIADSTVKMVIAEGRINEVLVQGNEKLNAEQFKERMVLLRLSNPQPTEKKDEKMKIALSLSYIEKPLQPDAFQLKENDF